MVYEFLQYPRSVDGNFYSGLAVPGKKAGIPRPGENSWELLTRMWSERAKSIEQMRPHRLSSLVAIAAQYCSNDPLVFFVRPRVRALVRDAVPGGRGRRRPGSVARHGIAAERAMMEATSMVNTHRGAILGLGLHGATAGLRDAAVKADVEQSGLLDVPVAWHAARLAAAVPVFLKATQKAIDAGWLLLAVGDGSRPFHSDRDAGRLAGAVSHRVDWAATLRVPAEAGAEAALDLGPDHALADLSSGTALFERCRSLFRDSAGSVRRFLSGPGSSFRGEPRVSPVHRTLADAAGIDCVRLRPETEKSLAGPPPRRSETGSNAADGFRSIGGLRSWFDRHQAAD